jgi:hypothetical protein
LREGRSGRRLPRDLRTGGHQPDRELAEERGIGTSCGEGEADAAGGFDDPGAELEKAQADGGELGRGEGVRRRDRIAHGEDQPYVDGPRLARLWADF